MGAGRAKSPGAWFSGKTLTMGVSGEHGGSASSGAGPAITVLHGAVQVEREGSKSCEWLTDDTVTDAAMARCRMRVMPGDATGARQRAPLPRWCEYYRTHLARHRLRVIAWAFSSDAVGLRL